MTSVSGDPSRAEPSPHFASRVDWSETAWRLGVSGRNRCLRERIVGGVGAQPETGGQRWPSRRFQASLRETGMPRAVMRLSTLQGVVAWIEGLCRRIGWSRRRPF